MSNHLKLPVVISPTRAELGMRCHRRHFLNDVLNRARYYSASLEFGSVSHAGVAAHWLYSTGRSKTHWSEVIKLEWQKRFDANPQLSQESVSLKLAEAMMEYYQENALLAGPFSTEGNWQLVDVEQRFEIPIGSAILSFQSDRAAFNPDTKHLVIVDSKTAARLDYRWDRQWETAIQMKLYKAGAARVYDGRFEKIDVVVEGLLKHVPSDIRYYVCPEWSNDMLGEAAHQALMIAETDEQVIAQTMSEPVLVTQGDRVELAPSVEKAEELAVRFTPVNYADCYAYGIECPFRRLCVADVNERVAILRGEYFEGKEEEY